MAGLTPTTLRGLIVPDPRITPDRIWAAQSTYTEAGPIPGVAEPQQETSLALYVSGTQSSGTLEVQALRGGGVGTSGLVWRQSGDTDWRGWDPPSIVTSFRTVSYETGTSEAGARWPHAVALSNGKVVVASCRSLGGTSSVRTRTIAADGTIGSAVTVQSQTTSGTLEMRPALVVLPSGRLVCFYFSYASTSWAIAAEYSDDDGASWTLLNPRAAAGPGASATYVPNFIRAAYSKGQIVLLAGYVDGSNRNVRQWASIDLGATFTVVSTYTSTSYDLLSCDVVGLDSGGFLASLWVYLGSNDFAVRSARIGSAFGSLSDQFTTDTGTTRKDIVAYSTGTTRDYGWVALAKADDGDVYAVLMWENASGSAGGRGETWVTDDEGRTWYAVGLTPTGTSPWYDGTNDAAHPKALAACWHRGRVLVYGNADQRSALPTNGNSLYEWALGGYSTVTQPKLLGTSSLDSRAIVPAIGWSAIETPASNGYTGAGTASANEFDAAKEGWEISTANPNTYVFTKSTAAAVASGCQVDAILRVDAGSGAVILRDGVGNYEVRVSVTVGSPTRMFFSDVQAGATLANPSVSSATWYHVRIWYTSGKATAWYRLADAGPDAAWTLLAEDQTLTAGAVTSDQVEFGAWSGGANETYWRHVADMQTQGLTDATYAAGFDNPQDLRPRPTSTLPVYLDDGVMVAARGGPAASGDEWEIETAHRYSVDRIHPRSWPSPSQGWRSTGTTGEIIAWLLTDETTGGYESDLWGLYIDATNIPQGKLQYTTVTTPTWQDASSFNLYESFSGVRSGSVVMPDPTGTAAPGRYIQRDELVGGYVKVSSGDVRKIIRNDEGFLTSGSTVQKRVRIYLDESQVDASDGTSGTFELRYPRGLFVFNSRWATTQGPLVGLRLAINTSSLDAPPEGYWQAGVVVLGPMAVFGTQYSATRRRSLAFNTQITETLDGRRRSRVVGKPRETVDVSWTEGLDESYIHGTSQDDHVLPSSGREPVAVKRDAIRMLWGLARELDGGAVPVVYVPEITSGAVSTYTRVAHRAGDAVYGRMTGRVDAETLLGNEGASELVRGSLTIEEEL